MEIILQYYGFSDFFNDQSGSFSGNPISYLALNPQHFLIFELATDKTYNLYVSQFKNENLIGNSKPEILELIVENYDKSNPKHRLALRAYTD